MAAHETNGSLYRVIQSLPLQIQHPTPSPVSQTSQAGTSSSGAPDTSLAMTSGSPPTQPTANGSPANATRKESVQAETPGTDPLSNPTPPATNANANGSASKPIATSSSTSNVGSLRIKPPSSVPASEPVTPVNFEFPAGVKSSANKADSPVTPANHGTPRSPIVDTHVEDDVFDVKETVNVLTLQFLSDHAETRIAALEWLLMLHLKAPQKVRRCDRDIMPHLR